jgi:hypothetical protein
VIAAAEAMSGRRRVTAFCMHTSSDAFVILNPGGRPGIAVTKWALPLTTDPCTAKKADDNATDAVWTQTARVQSRSTSTGLYICKRPDVPICNLARRGATSLYGLWGTHNPSGVVRVSPAPPAVIRYIRRLRVDRFVDRGRRSVALVVVA